ncbi:fibronectin type III domain-containing protein [Streptomyces sp. NPDC096310]|uniref:fibronectin type III domain-containing protein n=1 Tax=Streptomyces sp. NPDC096310 TaxID=3366082 RepID=UPI003807C5F9
MRDRMRTACRAVTVAVALAAAGGATAVPAVAAPTGITRVALPPAPTGLTYTYDAIAQEATVRWNPKDPADTVTTGYREVSCAGPTTADGPCFIRATGPLLTGDSFTFRLAAGRTFYFRLIAENVEHQYTSSAILTITTT